MTRKHFEAIAEVFRCTKAEHCLFLDDPAQAAEYMRRELIDDMAANLQKFNPAFDQARFKEACDG